MAYAFTLSDIIPATPKAIYDAWLDSHRHTAMTGSKAKQSAKVGAAVTAWGNYISGKNLALTPGKRIMQSWRTTQFTEAHEDSTITVTLAPVKGGTRVTLTHANVPDGQTSYQNGGWQDHYFRPMQAYFAKQGAKPTAKKATKKKKAKTAAKANTTKGAKRR